MLWLVYMEPANLIRVSWSSVSPGETDTGGGLVPVSPGETHTGGGLVPVSPEETDTGGGLVPMSTDCHRRWNSSSEHYSQTVVVVHVSYYNTGLLHPMMKTIVCPHSPV